MFNLLYLETLIETIQSHLLVCSEHNREVILLTFNPIVDRVKISLLFFDNA